MCLMLFFCQSTVAVTVAVVVVVAVAVAVAVITFCIGVGCCTLVIPPFNPDISSPINSLRLCIHPGINIPTDSFTVN
jgi:hypothetical protein